MHSDCSSCVKLRATAATTEAEGKDDHGRRHTARSRGTRSAEKLEGGKECRGKEGERERKGYCSQPQLHCGVQSLAKKSNYGGREVEDILRYRRPSRGDRMLSFPCLPAARVTAARILEV